MLTHPARKERISFGTESMTLPDPQKGQMVIGDLSQEPGGWAAPDFVILMRKRVFGPRTDAGSDPKTFFQVNPIQPLSRAS